MNAYKNVSYVGFVLMIFGVVICFYGFSFLLNQNELEANGVRVKGTVVEMVPNGPMYLSPVVKFKTEDGQELMFKSDMDLNMDITPYSVGMEVDVIYHKDDPTKAKIDNYLEANFAQIFLGAFGLLLIFIGFLVRTIFLRKAKKYGN